MANLKSGLILREDENLVMELEAELWATSMNPLARLWGSIVRTVNLILGNKRKGFIVITDKRVMEITQFKALWVLNAGKDVKYVLPSSVKEVGFIYCIIDYVELFSFNHSIVRDNGIVHCYFI